MPATLLISVDLPAPLSPTSAITSPGGTSKSTSVSACTEPNDLVMPRSWRRSGVSLTDGASYHGKGRGRPVRAPPRSGLRLLAVLLVLAHADLAALQVPRCQQLPPVGLRNRHRLDDVRRQPL